MYKGSLGIAGECMCTRPFSMHEEPEFLELLRIMREADTLYAHLEMNYTKKDALPDRAMAPTALRADQSITHELKWAGIDIVSCAYNHSMDWGYDSIMGTIEALDKAGIAHAGTGNNLEEAREPGYFESKAGRVAVVSMSSGHHPYDSAIASKAPVRGRHGVNCLRITQKYIVTPDILKAFKDAWAKLGLGTQRPFTVPGEEGDNFFVAGDFGGGNATSLVLRVGDKPGVLSIPDKWDLEANLRAVREARRQADLVIVAHHAAVNEGKRGDKPVSCIPAIAKQCIDAGADVYVGHGWHSLLGIEIYKGKPILYGTGNFWGGGFLERLPSVAYEGHGFNMDDLAKLTPADLEESIFKHMHKPFLNDQPGAIISTLNMEGGKFTGMKLYPLSMGYEMGDFVRKTGAFVDGRPMMTYGENARKIMDRIISLSAQYNTRIEYKDGAGFIPIK